MFYQNGFCNKYSVKTGRTRFTPTDTDFICSRCFLFLDKRNTSIENQLRIKDLTSCKIHFCSTFSCFRVRQVIFIGEKSLLFILLRTFVFVCTSLIKLNGSAQHSHYGFPILFHPSCHNRLIAFIVFPFLTGRMVAYHR